MFPSAFLNHFSAWGTHPSLSPAAPPLPERMTPPLTPSLSADSAEWGGACPFNLGPTCSGQTGLEIQVKRVRNTCRASRELDSFFPDAGDPSFLSRWKVRGSHGSKQPGGRRPLEGMEGGESTPCRSKELDRAEDGRGGEKDKQMLRQGNSHNSIIQPRSHHGSA